MKSRARPLDQSAVNRYWVRPAPSRVAELALYHITWLSEAAVWAGVGELQVCSASRGARNAVAADNDIQFSKFDHGAQRNDNRVEVDERVAAVNRGCAGVLLVGPGGVAAGHLLRLCCCVECQQGEGEKKKKFFH